MRYSFSLAYSLGVQVRMTAAKTVLAKSALTQIVAQTFW
jgi:hypothetical protein